MIAIRLKLGVGTNKPCLLVLLGSWCSGHYRPCLLMLLLAVLVPCALLAAVHSESYSH